MSAQLEYHIHLENASFFFNFLKKYFSYLFIDKAVILWYYLTRAWNRLGEMSERFKEPVLKTGDVKASVGSNPTLSAIYFNDPPAPENLTCGSTQVAEGAPLLRE